MARHRRAGHRKAGRLRRLCTGLFDTLVELHAVDAAAAGLASCGQGPGLPAAAGGAVVGSVREVLRRALRSTCRMHGMEPLAYLRDSSSSFRPGPRAESSSSLPPTGAEPSRSPRLERCGDQRTPLAETVWSARLRGDVHLDLERLGPSSDVDGARRRRGVAVAAAHGDPHVLGLGEQAIRGVETLPADLGQRTPEPRRATPRPCARWARWAPWAR